MDKTTLKKIMPFATDANIDKFLPHLNDTMATFEIDTPMRQAHFLAQIAHRCVRRISLLKSRMKVVHFVMSVKLLPEKHTKAEKTWVT